MAFVFLNFTTSGFCLLIFHTSKRIWNWFQIFISQQIIYRISVEVSIFVFHSGHLKVNDWSSQMIFVPGLYINSSFWLRLDTEMYRFSWSCSRARWHWHCPPSTFRPKHHLALANRCHFAQASAIICMMALTVYPKENEHIFVELKIVTSKNPRQKSHQTRDELFDGHFCRSNFVTRFFFFCCLQIFQV